MSYFRNDVAVAIGCSQEAIEEFTAMRKAMSRNARRFLKGPFMVVNCDYVYVMIPDGSKEGRETSDEMDQWRFTRSRLRR